jgi:hypothetical protein
MFLRLLTIAAAFFATADARKGAQPNACVSFQVSPGTGCQWMCNYCATTLGTPNYYFTDGVCTYETGGCVGSPQVGVLYTCCAN